MSSPDMFYLPAKCPRCGTVSTIIFLPGTPLTFKCQGCSNIVLAISGQMVALREEEVGDLFDRIEQDTIGRVLSVDMSKRYMKHPGSSLLDLSEMQKLLGGFDV